MNTINAIQYRNVYNTNFRGLSPSDICSKLCKGACCDHSTVMSMPLKIATDRLMGEFFKANPATRATLPIKKVLYSWGLDTINPQAKALNAQINQLLQELSKETSMERINFLNSKISELNRNLATLVNRTDEVFLPITNPKFINDPNEAVVSQEANTCMYKDPETHKCSIYYGLQTPEGETLQRPKPCHEFGSDTIPCPWHSPEKLNDTIQAAYNTLAQHGQIHVPKEIILRYVGQQFNLNGTWRDEVYLPYLEKIKKQG